MHPVHSKCRYVAECYSIGLRLAWNIDRQVRCRGQFLVLGQGGGGEGGGAHVDLVV